MKMTPQKAGSAFESIVDLSIDRTCYRPPLPPFGARMGKIRGQWAVVKLKMPFDRIVMHCRTQRMITFDMKSCADPRRFSIGDETHFPQHQRDNLTEAGRSGVLSGLLIEASCREVRKVFWLPWQVFVRREPSITWDDARLVAIGVVDKVIDFDSLIELFPLKPPGEAARAV